MVGKMFKSAVIAVTVPVLFVAGLGLMGVVVSELAAFLIGFFGTAVLFNYLMYRLV